MLKQTGQIVEDALAVVTAEAPVITVVESFGQRIDPRDRRAAAPLKVQQNVGKSSEGSIADWALHVLLFVDFHLL
jgi:hypothetical protein